MSYKDAQTKPAVGNEVGGWFGGWEARGSRVADCTLTNSSTARAFGMIMRVENSLIKWLERPNN